MKNTIEMVCTMNEGRSPVAEFIGQNFLLDNKLYDYSVISSGSGREVSDSSELQSNTDTNIGVVSLKSLIEQGIDQNIFTPDQLHEYSDAVSFNNRKKLEELFLYANQIFKQQERYFRADVVHNLVEKHGMSGYLKADSHQTTVRDDVCLILCMANNNKKQVESIYLDVLDEAKPKIVTLSEYATGERSLELPNAFGQGQDFYDKTIRRIQAEVPQAIKKFLEN